MSRSFALTAVLILATTSWTAAQQPLATDAQKIADASIAAPQEIVAAATILDWPSAEGGEFRVIRRGTNGWTCLPDAPGDANHEPMCLDAEWFEFVKALVAGADPAVKRVGLAYMLNTHWEGSNTSWTDKAATATNQWHKGGSHLMMVVPDAAMLAGYPTTPSPNGLPYVMWAGTKYAHVMIPVPDPKR